MADRLTLTRLSRRRRIVAGLPVNGSPCETPGCLGLLSVQNSHKSSDGTIQAKYLHCKLCGQKPNDHKWFVSLTETVDYCNSPSCASDSCELGVFVVSDSINRDTTARIMGVSACSESDAV
jgi:hypothetical protein